MNDQSFASYDETYTLANKRSLMPKDTIKLPGGRVVTFVYGELYPAPSTLFIQGVRSGRVKPDSDIAIEYQMLLPIRSKRLAEQVARVAGSADAVVSPPSTRDDATPYRQRVRDLVETKADLSERFFRRGHVLSASHNTSVEALVDDFGYVRKGDEAAFRSLIVVDDSLASGKTVSAVLQHLEAAGLRKDCQIWVAVWAWLKQYRPAPG